MGARKELYKTAKCGLGMIIPVEYFKVVEHSCKFGVVGYVGAPSFWKYSGTCFDRWWSYHIDLSSVETLEFPRWKCFRRRASNQSLRIPACLIVHSLCTSTLYSCLFKSKCVPCYFRHHSYSCFLTMLIAHYFCHFVLAPSLLFCCNCLVSQRPLSPIYFPPSTLSQLLPQRPAHVKILQSIQ